ncbi:hypothetical protein HZF08_02455 [Paenibacillus sp. CGMCC 1.16610]|uniref:DUF2306 domain-containing protein n=1 Tax=Paenibacillus anseongense TaxID=2682845 RepID=A0ABW9UCV7_9BACL|nr:MULTISPECIES: hypothetical protein [Paenibacillus]MBA2937158.1 hypothetical protein [Paenibacillus sp. CGMCC 1.16610]MVQ36220.1 hypothetical protein [Paenibacillus anseongense]
MIILETGIGLLQKTILIRKEKGLFLTGGFGILLALLCLVFMLVHGNNVPPYGDWIKPITFNFALGAFLITTFFMMPLAKFSVTEQKRFSWMLIITVLYAYMVEVIQTYRGVDPRFGQGDFLTNKLPGILFGVISLTIVGLYVVILIKFLAKKPMQERPLLVLGIRYGFIATMLGFSSGIWMIILSSRITGSGGNVMTIHFLGFHGLQAIPLIAWFLERSRLDYSRSIRIVHTAAWLWLSAIGCMFVQTYQGYSITAITPAMIVCSLLLIVWFCILVHSFLLYVRRKD